MEEQNPGKANPVPKPAPEKQPQEKRRAPVIKSPEESDNELSEEEEDEEEEEEEGEEATGAKKKGKKGRKPRECSTTLQAKWDEMFGRLVEFRRKHGHCLGKFVCVVVCVAAYKSTEYALNNSHTLRLPIQCQTDTRRIRNLEAGVSERIC
jgi:outer membrane biosynthesis protein TonB